MTDSFLRFSTSREQKIHFRKPRSDTKDTQDWSTILLSLPAFLSSWAHVCFGLERRTRITFFSLTGDSQHQRHLPPLVANVCWARKGQRVFFSSSSFIKPVAVFAEIRPAGKPAAAVHHLFCRIVDPIHLWHIKCYPRANLFFRKRTHADEMARIPLGLPRPQRPFFSFRSHSPLVKAAKLPSPLMKEKAYWIMIFRKVGLSAFQFHEPPLDFRPKCKLSSTVMTFHSNNTGRLWKGANTTTTQKT